VAAEHEHRPPANTPIRTKLGRITYAACVVCGARILYRLGNRRRGGEWIEVQS